MLPRTTLILCSILTVALPVKAANLGTIKICKTGSADIAGEEWNQEIVIPATIVFVDNGKVDDPDAPRIKLRVITLTKATISATASCATASAAIANDTARFGTDFGGLYVGPLITEISPRDKRVLFPEGQSTTTGKLPDRKMPPWDFERVLIQATIETKLTAK